MDGNTTVAKLADHLLGKDWYIADSVCGDQANEIILDEIRRKYPAIDETPVNKWRRLHKKCKWCHHCKAVQDGTIDMPVSSVCLAKDMIIAVDNSKPFCTVFELEPYEG